MRRRARSLGRCTGWTAPAPALAAPRRTSAATRGRAARRGPGERLQRWVERELGVHARGRLAGEAQRYFPQCRACSDRQAAAVRLDRRTLVAHFNGFRPPYASGAGGGVG